MLVPPDFNSARAARGSQIFAEKPAYFTTPHNAPTDRRYATMPRLQLAAPVHAFPLRLAPAFTVHTSQISGIVAPKDVADDPTTCHAYNALQLPRGLMPQGLNTHTLHTQTCMGHRTHMHMRMGNDETAARSVPSQTATIRARPSVPPPPCARRLELGGRAASRLHCPWPTPRSHIKRQKSQARMSRITWWHPRGVCSPLDSCHGEPGNPLKL